MLHIPDPRSIPRDVPKSVWLGIAGGVAAVLFVLWLIPVEVGQCPVWLATC